MTRTQYRRDEVMALLDEDGDVELDDDDEQEEIAEDERYTQRTVFKQYFK